MKFVTIFVLILASASATTLRGVNRQSATHGNAIPFANAQRKSGVLTAANSLRNLEPASACDPLYEFFNLQCYRPEKKANSEEMCTSYEVAYETNPSIFNSCDTHGEYFSQECYKDENADTTVCKELVLNYEVDLPQYGEECQEFPGCGAEMNCKFISDADGWRCLFREGLNPDGGFCRLNRQCLDGTDCEDYRWGGVTPPPTTAPTSAPTTAPTPAPASDPADKYDDSDSENSEPNSQDDLPDLGEKCISECIGELKCRYISESDGWRCIAGEVQGQPGSYCYTGFQCISHKCEANRCSGMWKPN